MATRIPMINPATLQLKDGFYGFSWEALFFAGIPAFSRGDIIRGLAAIICPGVGPIIMAIIYNKTYTLELIRKGYVFYGSDAENKMAMVKLGLLKEPEGVGKEYLNNPAVQRNIRGEKRKLTEFLVCLIFIGMCIITASNYIKKDTTIAENIIANPQIGGIYFVNAALIADSGYDNHVKDKRAYTAMKLINYDGEFYTL